MNPDQQKAIDAFLPFMPDVARWERNLQDLNQMWHLIEATAKMNCPVEARLLLPSIVATRTGLAQLERDLITNLVQEKVGQVLAELATRAQYVIDIVVRNLYERTADVGFLATDAELCRFVAGLDTDREAVRQRLADYRAKYTVYDEILILDTEGKVLVQTDQAAPPMASNDPLIPATLANASYLETFRTSNLRPDRTRALIYSQRMLHPETGAPSGVLCLSFHFEQEMEAVFSTYRDPGQRTVMLLLDAEDCVIASADPLWIPLGAKVPSNQEGATRPQMFGGRAYLVRTFASSGYQGYSGPAGWKGQLMIPLELAFQADDGGLPAQLVPSVLQGLLSHAHTFNPTLHRLMTAVTDTSRTIRRIVWNGKVTTAGAEDGNSKLNSVLDQITETGARSDDVFSRSIRDLYQTVLTSGLRAAESTSQLLVDMLDRNLYERANDCRWWALTPQLARGLAQLSDAEQVDAMATVLNNINRLYPVYRQLLVYDRSGRIIASSGAALAPDANIGTETAKRVCGLRSAQEHYAAPFGPSPFYDDQATFVYHAAIRHPEQESKVVGGIGIVFDAQPELLNMLHSGAAARPNLHAYFITPDGHVLGSTDAAYPPGSRLMLDSDLIAEASAGAASVSRIVAHEGQYKIAAATGARGYREFRAGASAEEEVIGVVLESYGPVREAQPLTSDDASDIASESSAGRDLAIFQADQVLMALPANRVQEAVPFARVRTTGGGGACVGMLNVSSSAQHFIWVFDLAWLVMGRASVAGPDKQVILVATNGNTIGLLVDDLHSVHRFDDTAMAPSPLTADGHALHTRVIKANQGRLLIAEIDVDRLFARVHQAA